MASGAIVYGESKIKAKDGLNLFYRYWRPPEPKATIVGVHGYAEHSGRYKHVGEFLAQNGFAFYIHDLRGHGLSDGERGFVNDFWEFINDLDLFVDHVRGREKIGRVFMLGHSMGGLISIIYAIEHPEKLLGLITSGAALKVGIKLSGIQENLMKILSKVRPKYRPDIKIDASYLTHDENVNRAYVEDELVFKRGTVRLFVEMIKAMNWAFENAERLSIPILMMHGSDDKIIPPEASKEFFKKIKVIDKELKIFPRFYHEIFNEKEKEKALNTALKWVNNHL